MLQWTSWKNKEAKLVPEVIPFTEVDFFFLKYGLTSSVSDPSLDRMPQNPKNLLENYSLLTVLGGMNRCFLSLFILENISVPWWLKYISSLPISLLLTTNDTSFHLLMCLLENFRGCCQFGKNIIKESGTPTIQYNFWGFFWH